MAATLSGGASPPAGCGLLEDCGILGAGLNGNQRQEASEPTGPFTVAAAYESGAGRVAVVADNAFQDHGLEGRNNEPLARALLEWLTGQRDAYAQLTIVPAVDGE